MQTVPESLAIYHTIVYVELAVGFGRCLLKPRVSPCMLLQRVSDWMSPSPLWAFTVLSSNSES
jgi:hypothetical protein